MRFEDHYVLQEGAELGKGQFSTVKPGAWRVSQAHCGRLAPGMCLPHTALAVACRLHRARDRDGQGGGCQVHQEVGDDSGGHRGPGHRKGCHAQGALRDTTPTRQQPCPDSATPRYRLCTTATPRLLQLQGNPNLIQLFADFEDPHYHYLVIELARGGELFHKIVEREVYTEQQARDTVREITKAMQYCHQHGVVHRDLKPENVLLAAPDDETIKIADFGFAKELGTTPDGMLHTACGTPGYVAPEILRQQPYGPSVDIWSLGVIFYILLCGYPPFHSDKGQDDLFRKIKHAAYKFDSPDWDEISAEAKDLISKILVPNPAQRLTADQILQHPWMNAGTVGGTNLSRARQNLVRFNARRKLKAAQKAVLTTVRMRRLLDGLRSAAASSGNTSPEEDEAGGSAQA